MPKTIEEIIQEFDEKFVLLSSRTDYALKSFLRQAITDAVIGELEGLEIKNDDTGFSELKVVAEMQNARWRGLIYSRISALRKKE